MPYTGQDFPDADVGEQLWLSIDFSRSLGGGDSVESATAQFLLLDGVDPTPNARLVGAPIIAGPQVGQLVNFEGLLMTPSQPDNQYRLIFTVQTAFGNQLLGWSQIRVADPTVE